MGFGSAGAGGECVVTARPESWELAWEDVQAADPGARLGDALAPGVFLVAAALDLATLAGRLGSAAPFVRHLFPVHYRLGPGSAAPEWDAAGAALAERLAPDLAAAVQLRWVGQGQKPAWVAGLRQALGLSLEQRAVPKAAGPPGQAISAVATDGGVWLGASATQHHLSPWSGGARPMHAAGAVSRSASKLLEAFEVFDLPWPDRGMALDLGAAPGGWTGVLVERGFLVVAVDPAALDERWARHPRVAHWRETAEVFAQRPRAAGGACQLLVNDMRLDAADSAQCMTLLADRLEAGGLAVMTLKLHETRRRHQIRAAVSVLASAFRVAGCRQLYHNRSEVTVAMVRR